MKLNKGEGNGPLLPAISVYNALQDTQCLFHTADTVAFALTTGSSTATSQSIFLQHNPWRSIWPPSARPYTVGLVARSPNTVYVSGGIGHPPRAASSSSSIKESAVAALCATLYQCGPTLGAKVCHQYYYSSGSLK